MSSEILARRLSETGDICQEVRACNRDRSLLEPGTDETRVTNESGYRRREAIGHAELHLAHLSPLSHSPSPHSASPAAAPHYKPRDFTVNRTIQFPDFAEFPNWEIRYIQEYI